MNRAENKKDLAEAKEFRRQQMEAKGARIAKHARDGQSPTEIARCLGMDTSSVVKWLRKMGVSYRKQEGGLGFLPLGTP
jgi:DNA-binding CsgD family transcriptional regulator